MSAPARPKRKAPRRRANLQLVVEVRGKQLDAKQSAAVLLEVSRGMDARHAQRRLARSDRRNGGAPERASVARAMIAVEDRLVRAFWTIARLPGDRIGSVSRNGIPYLPEQGETTGYRDAAGGDWTSVAPRPALPSSKEIDQAKEALDWLLLIDDDRYRRILVAGATSKRGDVGSVVRWSRVRALMPELHGLSGRTLRHRYSEALRQIVASMAA